MRSNLCLRKRRKLYFPREPDAPAPLLYKEARRIRLGQVDFMGYVWFGRYPELMADAATELCRRCGLSYERYRETDVMSVIAQLHVDYHLPLVLDETVTVKAAMVWTEASRLNIEYEILKEDHRLGATGFSVQMFIEAGTREVLLVSPGLLETLRRKWRHGEFRHLQ